MTNTMPEMTAQKATETLQRARLLFDKNGEEYIDAINSIESYLPDLLSALEWAMGHISVLIEDRNLIKRNYEDMLEKEWAQNAKLSAEIERLTKERSVPTEKMCDHARDFLMGLELGIKDYGTMIAHLGNCGSGVPEWMKGRTGHLTKWDKAECVWMLMATPPAPEGE